MSILVVGSVAFDSIETPHGKVDHCLGGAATHFSLAASLLDTVRPVGPVGGDFAESEFTTLRTRGTLTDDVRVVADVARLRRCERKQILAQCFFMSWPIGPKCAPGRPVRPEAFVVSDRILDDESLHRLRVRQDHAKADRAAVVLHVKRVM